VLKRIFPVEWHVLRFIVHRGFCACVMVKPEGDVGTRWIDSSFSLPRGPSSRSLHIYIYIHCHDHFLPYTKHISFVPSIYVPVMAFSWTCLGMYNP
jgi:hypothetical protein